MVLWHLAARGVSSQSSPRPAFHWPRKPGKKWVAGHGWDASRVIWGNCHPAVSCIHADPFLGPIAPGETVSTNGVLYLMAGTPEQCVERFQREFIEGHAGGIS